MNLTILKKINFEKIYLFLFMLLAFGLPLSKALTSIASALILLTWLIEGDFKRKFEQIKSSKILIFLLIFMAIIAAGYFYSDDKSQAIKIIRKTSYLLFALPIATSTNFAWNKRLILTLFISIFAVEIYALSPFIYNFKFAMSIAKNYPNQYFDPTMLSLQWSVFLATAALFSLNMMLKIKKINFKFFIYLSFFSSSLINLLLCGSRTGQMAFAIACILYGLIGAKPSCFMVLAAIGQ